MAGSRDSNYTRLEELAKCLYNNCKALSSSSRNGKEDDRFIKTWCKAAPLDPPVTGVEGPGCRQGGGRDWPGRSVNGDGQGLDQAKYVVIWKQEHGNLILDTTEQALYSYHYIALDSCRYSDL